MDLSAIAGLEQVAEASAEVVDQGDDFIRAPRDQDRRSNAGGQRRNQLETISMHMLPVTRGPQPSGLATSVQV